MSETNPPPLLSVVVAALSDLSEVNQSSPQGLKRKRSRGNRSAFGGESRGRGRNLDWKRILELLKQN